MTLQHDTEHGSEATRSTGERVAIDSLRYMDRFVRELPGDALSVNVPRQVLGACYSPVAPTPVASPRILALVPEVASLLDLSVEETPRLAEVLAGNGVAEGMRPYAACYGGHQFGNWAGQLGDGRAITLGEVENRRGEVWEMQLKGAGPTPYSRRADGRAVLRSSVRELVCSEAMHHLGVPTTRALSLVMTGDGVERDMLYDGRPAIEPGAIVCRVAPSFLRFGNYEIHAARGDLDTLRTLLTFTMQRFFPQFIDGGGKLDLAGFLTEVTARTARLMVEWTRVGFVHGVMNTDNMSILGLTIDYGPYGWMEPYDPDWTPNTTDASGRRYRFGNQPQVAFWNVVRLAHALAALEDDVAPLEKALATYPEVYQPAHRKMMLSKLGLTPKSDRTTEDDELVSQLFSALTSVEVDMTIFFRSLATVDAASSSDESIDRIAGAFYAPLSNAGDAGTFKAWLARYRARMADESESVSRDERVRRMNAVNPLYVPRNYLLQLTIDKTLDGDRTALTELLEVFRRPYTEQPGRAAFAEKRPEWARHRVGCSMLSCSS